LDNIRQGIWPKVTVVIINWNSERFLDRCLSALLAQTVMPHEIILVDNASSDASLGILHRFPSVRVLAQNNNLGFARGNNKAIEAASPDTEWIAFLNPDAFAEPRWLETLLLTARDHPAFDMFSSKLVNATDPAILDGAGDAYHISGRVRRIGHGERMLSFTGQIKEVFSPCAAAALYRQSALLEAGYFDDDYFCYVEDVDLGFRLRLLGYRCLFVPESIAHHIGSAITGDRSDFSVYHGHRNLVWTYVKNMPGILFWLLLPIHLAFNFTAVVYFTLRGQGRIILRAKRDAIKGISQMWRKRRQIQKSRRASVMDIWRMLDKHIL
jgi:GT2 family glycosyltransferase